MKKITALFFAGLLLFLLPACSSGKLTRGQWKDRVYYNKYGNFKIEVNDYFDIYTDKEIANDLGAVYPQNNVLNDMVISSDYCAIIVTMEKTNESFGIEQYVSQFIENTKSGLTKENYAISDTFTRQIAGELYQCVPVTYIYDAGDVGVFGYYEYDFIRKADDGVFIIIRVTGGNQSDILSHLNIIQEI